MTTENWDLRAFIFGCADLDDEEKNLCYDALNREGFSSGVKRRALLALDDADLRSLGIKRLSTRKVLLLAITGEAAGPGSGSTAAASPLGLLTLDERASAMMTLLCDMHKLPAAGEVLSFEPSSLLLDPKFNRVYIRACYGPLFEELRTSECKDIIITGTPGIGKSWFLYYLLARLVALRGPPPYILWEHMTKPGEMRCYDRASRQVHWGTRQSFHAQLENCNAWYISDGIPPDLSSLARIILITSPRRATFKEMAKSGARTLYVPLWTLEELLDCRTKVYGDRVPEDRAKCLYEYYGGVARYVLGVPSQAKPSENQDVLLQPLTTALDASSPAQVQAGIGGLEVGPEASHRLLHIVAKDNFELSHLYFASPWVADAIVARAMKDGLNGLLALMAGTRGAIRGHLFEQLMHRLLSQGGTFTVVPICRDTLTRAKAEEELQLPSCTSRSFKDVAEISADGFPEDVYYMPVQSNFPTVDSLVHVDKTCLRMFQMTVDSSKTVSASALTSLFDKLGTEVEDLDLCLYYVVPPDIFEGFKLRADKESWPPGKGQRQAARTRLYLLKGDAEAQLQPQQHTRVSRKRPPATAAAARPAAMMMAAAAFKHPAAPSSGRVSRTGGRLLSSWR